MKTIIKPASKPREVEIRAANANYITALNDLGRQDVEVAKLEEALTLAEAGRQNLRGAARKAFDSFMASCNRAAIELGIDPNVPDGPPWNLKLDDKRCAFEREVPDAPAAAPLNGSKTTAEPTTTTGASDEQAS